jgi:hypothetical protein
MPITSLTHAAPIIEGRNERSAAHSFSNDGRDVSFFLQNVFNVIRAFQRTLPFAIPGTMSMIRRRDVLTTWQLGSNSLAENALSADRNRIE